MSMKRAVIMHCHTSNAIMDDLDMWTTLYLVVDVDHDPSNDDHILAIRRDHDAAERAAERLGFTVLSHEDVYVHKPNHGWEKRS